jgi:hypothetical protein
MHFVMRYIRECGEGGMCTQWMLKKIIFEDLVLESRVGF